MATEAADRTPKYQRIADELREAIRVGEYGPGDRLPGENDLMASYSVARMTARQALGVLQSEGVAESRKTGPADDLDRPAARAHTSPSGG